MAAPWDPSRSLVRGGRGGHGAPPHSLPLKPSCRQAPVPEGGCCLSRKLHLHWPAGRGPGVSLGARQTLPRDPPAPHRPATPGAPHQVLQPQHYLWALEFPELPEDARATSWDLGATVRGASILPFSSSRPVPGAPPGGRAWWFSIGAPWLGTSEKMPAMRLFTCFLQLLAGLALPAVPPQVRPAPTAQPGSPDLPTLSTQSRRCEITDPLPRAALLRMPTHFSGDRLDQVVWEETSG